MNNSYILLRHAHSKFSSDDFNRTLSEKGFSSLDQLEFLNSFNIDYYFSSPYKRAFETVNSSPIQFDKIVLDNRLRERKLSSTFIKDSEFEDSIKYLWQNPSESLSGGESNQDALARVLNFLMELEERYSEKTILLSSHGNLIGILLNHFDSSFDYEKWEQMTFPDCFLIDRNGIVKRIMKDHLLPFFIIKTGIKMM